MEQAPGRTISPTALFQGERVPRCRTPMRRTDSNYSDEEDDDGILETELFDIICENKETQHDKDLYYKEERPVYNNLDGSPVLTINDCSESHHPRTQGSL